MSLLLFLVIEMCLYLCVLDVDTQKYSFMVKAMNSIYCNDLEMDSKDIVISL